MTTHDYRKSEFRWGWNITYYKMHDDTDNKAFFMGIGRGIKQGDRLLLNYGNGDFIVNVDEINYEWNPRDLWKATVSGVENQ